MLTGDGLVDREVEVAPSWHNKSVVVGWKARLRAWFEDDRRNRLDLRPWLEHLTGEQIEAATQAWAADQPADPR